MDNENDLYYKGIGWEYKGNFNLLREILKDIPKEKIEIIPDDPKDQMIAGQMSDILNSMVNDSRVECE